MQNIISLDVEDYASADRWRPARGRSTVSPRVVDDTRRVLELFDTMGVRATCFVLGRVAAAVPELVREIAERGHEVASHGYAHLRMRFLTPQAFGEDLRASLAVLQDALGYPVHGFRAPGFSLSAQERWAFPIMASCGLTFDSSIRVTWPFGLAAGRRLIAAAAAVGIREIPGFRVGIGRVALPLGGGAILGLLPGWTTAWGIRRLNRAGFPVPLYLHSYDITVGADEPWERGTWIGRLGMRLFLALQSVGRRRLAGRLQAAAAVGGVTPVGGYLDRRDRVLLGGSTQR
ncbi:MAG TPA: polysaccharide deacetylase family protein [bacterium]